MGLPACLPACYFPSKGLYLTASNNQYRAALLTCWGQEPRVQGSNGDREPSIRLSNHPTTIVLSKHPWFLA